MAAHWRAAAGDAKAADGNSVASELLPAAARSGMTCGGDGVSVPTREFTSFETMLPPTALVEGGGECQWGGAEPQAAAGRRREDRRKRFKASLVHESQPSPPPPASPPSPPLEVNVMKREWAQLAGAAGAAAAELTMADHAAEQAAAGAEARALPALVVFPPLAHATQSFTHTHQPLYHGCGRCAGAGDGDCTCDGVREPPATPRRGEPRPHDARRLQQLSPQLPLLGQRQGQ